MASAQAKIEVVVKNLRSLDKIEKALTKINSQNDKLIASLDKVVSSLSNIEKAVVGVGKEATNSQKQLAGTTTQTTKLLKGQVSKWYGIRQTINAVVGALRNAGLAAFNFNKSMMKTWQLTMKLQKFNKNLYVDYFAQSKAPLSELNQIISNLQKELSQYHSSQMRLVGGDQKAIDVKNQLAGALREQSVEQAKVNNLLREAQGITQLGPGGKGRGFGSRFVNTPEREAAKARDRGINQRRAEAITDRFNRTKQLQRGIEFKNLPTVKLQRQLLAIEKKRELLLRRQVRRQEKLNMMAQSQGMVGTTGFTAAQYGPQPLPLTMAEQLGFGQRANAQGPFASRGGMGGRIRGAGSSAMIGGMFPLLFGQGGAASLGGGLGGAAGGILGGGFGFGLSLIGTVIGSKIQEIDDFNKSLTRLNATLSSSGDGFKTTGKDVSELAKRLGVTKQEAINVLNAFAQFDSSGVRQSLANVFGTDAGAVDQIASARTEASLVQTIFEKRQELGLEVTEQLIDQSKIVDNATLEFALVTATLKKKKEIAVEEAKRISIMERMNALVNPFKDPTLIFAPENKDRAAKIAAGFEDTFQEDVDNALQSFQDLRRVMDKVALASATDLAEALREVNIEITKLQNPTYQLIEAANAISGAFSESFKGVIRGTMSVQEAFANMFNRIADHFLDMAAKMAANQLLTSILSAFAPAVSGPSAPKLNRVTGNPGPRTAPIIPRATGGYVTRPEISLIGEAGEDEYVIPASKMASSMQRYSAGARGDSVVAGGGSSYAGGGAGGSTTVNYSGPILNFNSEEFVPKSAIGQIIATATARGSRAGEVRTLSSLQNSRSRRSSLGL